VATSLPPPLFFPAKVKRVAVQSKSWLERAIALAMACGFVLATSLGSLHDPNCSHHVGGAGHESWYGSPGHGGGVEVHPAGEHAHGEQPEQTPPDDCTCHGGLCVLTVVVAPPVRTAEELSFGVTEPAALVSLVDVAPAAVAEGYHQPPGRAPPALV
jgi:hypothetical protein